MGVSGGDASQTKKGHSATRVKHCFAASMSKSSKHPLWRIAMRPTMRLPTVEFRSLLLPPIRVPLRALQALHRPHCAPSPRTARSPQCLTQRRFLNLYKTAKAKTVLGQHKALNFVPYEVSLPSEATHRINLYNSDKRQDKTTLIAENISFQDVYDKHIKDGRMLFWPYAVDKSTAGRLFKLRGEDIISEHKDYAIMDAHMHNIPINAKQRGSQLGGCKVLIFNLASPVSHHRIILDRAYQFIEAGAPVEFRIRMQGTQLSKEERIQPGSPEVWPWMHNHVPHLRPDFIMKSMPTGTIFLVKPVSDGRHLQWVMSKPATQMPPIDLTTRFLRVKESVKQSIREGKQSQLPKTMRKQLVEAGLNDYSPNTGLPRLQAREKFGQGGKVTYGAEETKHMRQNAEPDAFMLPDPEMQQEYRFKMQREDEKHGLRRRNERETSEFTRTELQRRAPWKMGRGRTS
jgi:hypothetical protein